MAFWIKAVDSKFPDGDWKIQHYQGFRSHIHNHPPVKKIQLTLFRRYQQRQLVKDIKDQKASGIKTQQSLALLQMTHPELHITLQDLQNERKRLRQEAIKHHTPAEACLNLLDELKFYKDFEVGEDSRVQRLFFTDPKSIELAKTHSDILMLDCTYQTNKYGLPLLNIIGTSSLHKTTQIGLAFLSGEAEHDFDWVIRVLRRLFKEHQIRLPRIIVTDRQLDLINALKMHFQESNYLLRWHFNKCVLAKARTTIHRQVKGKDDKGNETYFDHADTLNFMHRFYHCIDADEVKDFESERDSLMADYPCMRAYFEKNWWPYKERLAKCYTNRYRHFGEQCSSRCQGQHSCIKR